MPASVRDRQAAEADGLIPLPSPEERERWRNQEANEEARFIIEARRNFRSIDIAREVHELITVVGQGRIRSCPSFRGRRLDPKAINDIRRRMRAARV